MLDNGDTVTNIWIAEEAAGFPPRRKNGGNGMKLDKTFARETTRTANGDGSREAKFAFLKAVREVNKALSTPEVRSTYDDCIKRFGRVPVAICTAATIYNRRDRLNEGPVRWAAEVLKLWTIRPSDLCCAHIDDSLHPARIEEYADSLIRATTLED